MIFKILESLFLIFSNILLSLPFTIFGLSKFDPLEIKADWQPPGYVFGIVWPILYLLFSIINIRIMISKNISTELKNQIISDSLLEAILQALWVFVTIKFGESRKFIQYVIGLFVMLYLVYHCYFIRKPIFKLVDITSYYLYVPYSIWIVFALILNLQIILKYYNLGQPLF